MLDSETKRKIDSCRDILVGKVPDPKSQVEQITVALIFKFMDDMDAQAEELGGERRYFTGDYARYSWVKLLAPGVGGQEMLNLYSEAMTKMTENEALPRLFRDIFKNAYLPYRDPETLRAFLREINAFTYDHSEKLGDAFEYLLSVLGSQGDAGQFRTPRHIIDFLVEIIDPQKHEVILDPACGTAGFLISAYKHILKHNSTGEQKNKEAFEEKNAPPEALILDNPLNYKGDLLTPEEKKTLVENIVGYDISPDMTRLSLVNLYLHGFPDPKIEEYDTLTSERKWGDYADVILANPPFMSPKGGIKPHNRFSVESKRSEVLFVDYIAEHLTANGRAAIIVPEGIIFQSGTAYKTLRASLLNKSLIGVISLPAGVFQPYSGVKTSVLILDKPTAKRAENIFFLKIEHDGFGLGAQRRPVDKSDLPQAARDVRAYITTVKNGEPLDASAFAPNFSIVSRAKIRETADHNFSGERYIEEKTVNSRYPMVRLGDVAEVIAGQSPEGEYYNENGDGMPFYQGKSEFKENVIGDSQKWTTKITKLAFKNDILMSVRAPVGPVNLCIQTCCIGRGLAAIRVGNKINNIFLFYNLKAIEGEIVGNIGAAFASINKQEIENIKIPLPPLSVQQEIVTEIESYQKIIDGARQIVAAYRPRIDIKEEWERVRLGDVCVFKRGPFGGDLKKEIFVSNGYAIYEQNHAINNCFENFRYFITAEKFNEMKQFQVCPNDIIMSCSGTMGKIGVVPISAPKGIINQALLKLTVTSKIKTIFLKLFLETDAFQQALTEFTFGAAIQNVASVKILKEIKIPLPPLHIQQEIVARITHEQSLVNSAQELITLYEEKIKAVIGRVWEGGEGDAPDKITEEKGAAA